MIVLKIATACILSSLFVHGAVTNAATDSSKEIIDGSPADLRCPFVSLDELPSARDCMRRRVKQLCGKQQVSVDPARNRGPTESMALKAALFMLPGAEDFLLNILDAPHRMMNWKIGDGPLSTDPSLEFPASDRMLTAMGATVKKFAGVILLSVVGVVWTVALVTHMMFFVFWKKWRQWTAAATDNFLCYDRHRKFPYWTANLGKELVLVLVFGLWIIAACMTFYGTGLHAVAIVPMDKDRPCTVSVLVSNFFFGEEDAKEDAVGIDADGMRRRFSEEKWEHRLRASEEPDEIQFRGLAGTHETMRILRSFMNMDSSIPETLGWLVEKSFDNTTAIDVYMDRILEQYTKVTRKNDDLFHTMYELPVEAMIASVEKLVLPTGGFFGSATDPENGYTSLPLWLWLVSGQASHDNLKFRDWFRSSKIDFRAKTFPTDFTRTRGISVVPMDYFKSVTFLHDFMENERDNVNRLMSKGRESYTQGEYLAYIENQNRWVDRFFTRAQQYLDQMAVNFGKAMDDFIVREKENPIDQPKVWRFVNPTYLFFASVSMVSLLILYSLVIIGIHVSMFANQEEFKMKRSYLIFSYFIMGLWTLLSIVAIALLVCGILQLVDVGLTEGAARALTKPSLWIKSRWWNYYSQEKMSDVVNIINGLEEHCIAPDADGNILKVIGVSPDELEDKTYERIKDALIPFQMGLENTPLDDWSVIFDSEKTGPERLTVDKAPTNAFDKLADFEIQMQKTYLSFHGKLKNVAIMVPPRVGWISQIRPIHEIRGVDAMTCGSFLLPPEFRYINMDPTDPIRLEELSAEELQLLSTFDSDFLELAKKLCKGFEIGADLTAYEFWFDIKPTDGVNAGFPKETFDSFFVPYDFEAEELLDVFGAADLLVKWRKEYQGDERCGPDVDMPICLPIMKEHTILYSERCQDNLEIKDGSQKCIVGGPDMCVDPNKLRRTFWSYSDIPNAVDAVKLFPTSYEDLVNPRSGHGGSNFGMIDNQRIIRFKGFGKDTSIDFLAKFHQCVEDKIEKDKTVESFTAGVRILNGFQQLNNIHNGIIMNKGFKILTEGAKVDYYMDALSSAGPTIDKTLESYVDMRYKIAAAPLEQIIRTSMPVFKNLTVQVNCKNILEPTKPLLDILFPRDSNGMAVSASSLVVFSAVSLLYVIALFGLWHYWFNRYEQYQKPKDDLDDERFLRSCANGDVKVFKKMIENGVDPMLIRDGMLNTPLHFAVNNDKPDGLDNRTIVKLLLDLGLNPNEANAKGYSALHLAVSNQNERMTEMLFEYGGDLNAMDRMGDRPLSLMTRANNKKMIKKLISLGADPREVDDGGMSPVAIAKKLGFTDILEIFAEDKDDRQKCDTIARVGELKRKITNKRKNLNFTTAEDTLKFRRNAILRRKKRKQKLYHEDVVLGKEYYTMLGSYENFLLDIDHKAQGLRPQHSDDLEKNV